MPMALPGFSKTNDTLSVQVSVTDQEIADSVTGRVSAVAMIALILDTAWDAVEKARTDFVAGYTRESCDARISELVRENYCCRSRYVISMQPRSRSLADDPLLRIAASEQREDFKSGKTWLISLE